MADVYLSFAREERDRADLVRMVLERNQLSCAMADDAHGAGAAGTAQAIEGCGVVVLVLSKAAQESAQVRREVEVALDCGKPMLPLAIEDCALVHPFSIYFNSTQRNNAYDDVAAGMERLVSDVCAVLGLRHGAVEVPREARDIVRKSQGQGNSPLLAIIAILAIACIALAVMLVMSGNKKGAAPSADSSDATAEQPAGEGAGEEESSAEETSAASYSLGVSRGRVAIFSSASAEPYESSDVSASDLAPATAVDLESGVSVSSLDEARDLVKEYDEEATARRAATAELTVMGVDGTTRTSVIRRDPATERVFPDSNTRALTAEEVQFLSDAEKLVAWNEIVASNDGYTFKNSGLAEYFGNCSWYTPTPGASWPGDISAVAKANVDLLQASVTGWWLDLALY